MSLFSTSYYPNVLLYNKLKESIGNRYVNNPPNTVTYVVQNQIFLFPWLCNQNIDIHIYISVSWYYDIPICIAHHYSFSIAISCCWLGWYYLSMWHSYFSLWLLLLQKCFSNSSLFVLLCNWLSIADKA